MATSLGPAFRLGARGGRLAKDATALQQLSHWAGGLRRTTPARKLAAAANWFKRTTSQALKRLVTPQARPGFASLGGAPLRGISKIKLIEAAMAPFKGQDISHMARALEKHGGRPGSVWPKPTGRAQAKNARARTTIEEFLGRSDLTVIRRKSATIGNVVEVRRPDGVGLRFRSGSLDFVGLLQAGPLPPGL